MESARLYMWQNPVGGLEDGARGRVEGDYEGMHKCESIFREGANTCAVARSGGAMKNK